MRILAPLCLALVASVPAFAQDDGEPPPEEAPITKLPKLVKEAQADYPKDALRERIEASVVLLIEINETGLVDNVDIVGSSTVAEADLIGDETAESRTSTITDYGFEEAAMLAAISMEFEPAESNGTPIAVAIQYTYNFKLPPPPLPPPLLTQTATTVTSTVPTGPSVVNFRGLVREQGNRKRVAAVVVTVFQGEGEEAIGYEAITDKEGIFEFRDLPAGEWKVLAEAEGYYPVRDRETIEVGKLTEVTYYIEKGSYSEYEVVVSAQRVKKEVVRRTLKIEEIVKVPGTLGDPVKIIQNLPGVARPPGLSGQLLIRGSGPQDSGVFFDDIAVPLVYHFGGLKAVVPAEMIDSIDFYPGNYSVKYGRFTGGVFNGNIKRLNPDQIHGSLDVSLLDAGLYLEIPITDELAVAVAGRRSYIDAILSAAVPDDASVALTSAPRYYDYQALVSWRPNPAHSVKGFFLGSDDALEVLFENPSDFAADVTADQLRANTRFNRGWIEHAYTPNDEFQNEIRASIGNDQISASLGTQFRFNLDVFSAQIREEMNLKMAEWVTMTAGVDWYYQSADVEVLAPSLGDPNRDGRRPGLDDEDLLFAQVENRVFNQIAPFLEAQLFLFDNKLTLTPGLRLDYFSQVSRLSFDPRLVVRYDFNPEWAIKGGAGFTHQSPQPQELDATFGNPALGLQRSVQYSVGGEWSPKKYLRFDVVFFYKDLLDLVSSVNRIDENGNLIRFDNGGIGDVYGMEVFIDHKLNNNFRGWVSYTLSRATRKLSGETEFQLFPFDQTHIFNAVMSYSFPENWEVGVRWRLVTGSPQTTRNGGAYDVDLDAYVAAIGGQFNARLPIFHQLDLRVDKTWIFTTFRVSAYLSLLNTYNRGNAEAFSYNFDFTQQSFIQGLPILPILGMRGDF